MGRRRVNWKFKASWYGPRRAPPIIRDRWGLGLLFFAILECALSAHPTFGQTAQNELIEAIQNCRALTFSAQACGEGSAAGAGLDRDRTTSTPAEHNTTRVTFKFSGQQSISWYFNPPASTKPLLATFLDPPQLITDVEYPNRTSGVQLSSPASRMDVSTDLKSWSVEGISSIPTFSDDVEFFAFLKSPPNGTEVEISRSGSQVTVAISRVGHDALKDTNQKILTKFDMSLGGLTTSYEYNNAVTFNHHTKTLNNAYNVSWKLVGTFIVPEKRSVKLSRGVDDHRDPPVQSDISFTEYKIKSGQKVALSLQDMDLADGTPVSDARDNSKGSISHGQIDYSAPKKPD